MLADAEICRRIVRKVRGLWLRQNFTQMSLAEQAQISVSTLKRIEEGEIRSFDSLMRILLRLDQLDIFTPLLEEDKMSPNEYYEFMEAAKKKGRKRASISKKSHESATNKEESEW